MAKSDRKGRHLPKRRSVSQHLQNKEETEQSDAAVSGRGCGTGTVVLNWDDGSFSRDNGKNLLVCLVCSTTFESDTSLSSHICTHACRNGRFRPTCSRVSPNKKTLIRHMQRYGSRSGVPLAWLKRMKQHCGAAVEGESKSQTCVICDKRFKKRKNFERHMKLHTELHRVLLGASKEKVISAFHRFSMKYFCRSFIHKKWLLSERINSDKDFQKHSKLLHFHHKRSLRRKTKPQCYEKVELRCGFCSKNCRTATSLMLHKSVHKSIRCTVCQKEFSSYFTRIVHLKRHEFTKWKNNSTKKQGIGSKREKTRAGTRNVCSICEKSFSSRSCLNRHQRVHTGEKPYKCLECGEKFKERLVLRKHIAKHTGIPLPKKYQCEICNKSFALSSVLQQHMRGHGEKKFKCSHCNKKFAHQKLLDRHATTHDGTKFTCGICGKGFLTKNNMQRHTKTHSDEKPFKCEWCGKVFRQSGNLKTHVRIHTKEKPYACDKCGRRFTQSANMKQHLLLHDGNRVFSSLDKVSGQTPQASNGSVTMTEPKTVSLPKIPAGHSDIAVDEPDSSFLPVRFSQKNGICCQHCQKSFSNARDFPWHDCTLPQQDDLHTSIVQEPVDETFKEREDISQNSVTVSYRSPVAEQASVFQSLENAKSESNLRLVAELAYKQDEYSVLNHQLPTPRQTVQSFPQGVLTYPQHAGTFLPSAIPTLTSSAQSALLVRPSSGSSQVPILDSSFSNSNQPDLLHFFHQMP